MVTPVSESQGQESGQQELVSLLRRELDHVQELMRALEQEYAALAEPHTATLEEIVRSKQGIVHELEQIGRQRESLLSAMNSSIEQQLDPAAHKSALNRQFTALWSDLVSLAEQCQEMNRINGSIIELVSRQSRHALDILHGISPGVASRSELYDRSGYKTMSAESRSLTKA